MRYFRLEYIQQSKERTYQVQLCIDAIKRSVERVHKAYKFCIVSTGIFSAQQVFMIVSGSPLRFTEKFEGSSSSSLLSVVTVASCDGCIMSERLEARKESLRDVVADRGVSGYRGAEF